MFAKWISPEAVFKIIRDLTAGRPCDITGIADYDHIDARGGIQWPFPLNPAEPVTAQERRLFSDGHYHTATRKANFLYSPPSDLPEAPDAEFPFLLLTGRGTSSQWHTQTRTGKSAVLRKLYPEKIYIEIHPSDADRLRISANSLVRIASRRGEVTASAYIAPTVQPGQVFLPMHYPEVNQLTHSSFDPHSRQPNYKASAVSIQPA